MLRGPLVALLLVAPTGAALAGGQAIALKAGALGIGVEYTRELTERLAVRGGLNGSRIGFNDERSGIAYGFDLVWDSLSVAVDFHPLKSAFRVSGGILRNDDRLDATSRVSGNVTVGRTRYTPDEVGTLRGRLTFSRASPFVGVGWDWSRTRRRFGMSFDLGVLDQGPPRVSLVASGALSGIPRSRQTFAPSGPSLRIRWTACICCRTQPWVSCSGSELSKTLQWGVVAPTGGSPSAAPAPVAATSAGGVTHPGCRSLPFTNVMSTRRFNARCSGVSLGARGCVSA